MKLRIIKKINKLNILWISHKDDSYVFEWLKESSKSLTCVNDASKGFEYSLNKAYDVILIDSKLEGISALDFIKKIRKVDIMISIVLVAHESEQSLIYKSMTFMIEGLVLKPVKIDTLCAAFNQCIKRIDYLYPAEYMLSKNMLYLPNTRELRNNGISIALAKKEAQLLELFLENIGRIVKIQEIERELWHNETMGPNALKSVISRLRKDIGKESICSHSGVGYSLERRLI